MPTGIQGIQFGGSGGGGGPYQTYYIFQDDSGQNYARVGSKMILLTSNPNNNSTVSSSFCVFNNLIYQIGGWNGTTNQNNLDVYNPLNNKWTALTDGTGRELAGFVGINNKLYYFGGVTGGNVTTSNRMDIYDIIANTWTTGSNVPITNGNETFGYCAYQNSIFMIGGFTQTGIITNATTYRYDVDANNWVKLANIPNANGLSYTSVTAYSNYIWVAGGKDGSSGNAVSTFYRYDIVNNVYTTMPALPVGRFGTNGTISNNNLYLLGGNTTVPINTVIYFNFGANAWSADSLNLTNNSGNNGFNGLSTIEPISLGGA